MIVVDRDFGDEDDNDWEGFWDEPEEFVIDEEAWDEFTESLLDDEEDED